MIKLVATLNVIAWSGFWAFGYVALASSPANAGQMTWAVLFAAVGAGVGMLTYFRCIRHCEFTGYAKTPNRVPEHVKTQGEAA